MHRTCNRCGHQYTLTDTITRCTEVVGGTFCGGNVLPPYVEHVEGVACLVCMDSGEVTIAATSQHPEETRACPNPTCKAKAKVRG